MCAAATTQSPRRGVAVWEWEKKGRFRPYAPEVSQALEKANQKNFTQFFLRDADPDLGQYHVNFSTMQQCCDLTDATFRIRREVYDSESPAGQGARWEWAGDNPGEWHVYDMRIQCIIDYQWAQGNQTIDLSEFIPNLPYTIHIENLTQVNNHTKYVRSMRRLSHLARYPAVRDPPNVPLQSLLCPRVQRPLPNPPVEENTVKVSKTKAKKPSGKAKSKDADRFTGYLSKTMSKTKELFKKDKTSASKNTETVPINKSGRQGSIDTLCTYLSQESGEAKDKDPVPVLVDISPTSNVPSSTRGYNHGGVRPKQTTTGQSHRENYEPSRMEYGQSQAHQLLQKYVTADPNCSDSGNNCPICLCELRDDNPDDFIVRLKECKHLSHYKCLVAMVDHGIKSTKNSHFQCPTCKKIYGEKCGIQPNGSMTTSESKIHLPGHENCGTIIITYSFQNGIQGPEHPNPGKPYRAVGFPRICYLPNNEKGKKVLKLLKVAFSRRLTFTVGQSATTGLSDVITWNEIHHKTEIQNYYGHGYPDPNYLDNVLQELASHGVT